MKLRRSSYLFTLLIFTAVLLCPALSPDAGTEEKPLVFAGSDKFAPYSFYNKEDAPSGFSVDLIRIISATLGRDIQVRLMPWDRCITELRAGGVDGLIGAPVYKERERYMDFTDPVAEIEFAIFVERGNTYVNSLKSLEGTLVSVHAESLIIDRLQKYGRITLVRTESIAECLEKLKNREITAVISEKTVALYYIQQENIKDIKIVGPRIGPAYSYSLALRKDNAKLLKEMNAAINALEKNGTLQKLKRKWFGLRLVEPFPWKMVSIVIGGITGTMIMLLGLLWVVSLDATLKAKTKQIQMMSQKMVEKDKLAVLGQLAGQIAHELRTPLSIINNSVYLLRKEGSKNRDLFEKRLRILEEKIKLSSNILESILSYSRVKAEVAADVSIKECVEEVLKDLDMPEGITKKVTIEEKKSLFVFMDFHQLYSVIRNIILNSLQAMGEEGTLTVDAFLSDKDTMVNIRICDTGKGIMESARTKVFNLFYSTKITGTGLGLPISKSIIEANQGTLILDETSEKGTCFTIKLPSSKVLKNE